MTDEQMDARLRAAGAQWRAAVATVEPAAGPAPMEIRADEATTGSRTGRRHRGAQLSAALVAAAIVVGGALAVRAAEHGSSNPAADAASLRNTVWRLVQYGGVRQPHSSSTLYIGADGRFVADDSCQVVAGPTTIDSGAKQIDLQPEVIRPLPCTDSAGEVTFGQRAINGFTTSARFAVSGDHLTITPGTGPQLHLVAAPGLLPPTEDVPSIDEATWVLTAVRATDGRTLRTPKSATFRIHDGTLTASDGCNTLSGSAAVDGRTIARKPLALTAIGCTDPAVSASAAVTDAVLQDTGLVWSISASRLTLTARGAGALTYVWSPDNRAATDPARLRQTTWYLRSIAGEPIGIGGRLRFGADGSLTGTDGCQALHARASITHGFLTTSGVPATSNGTCPVGAATVNSFLRASPVRWRVEDGRLVLYGGSAQAFSAVFAATGSGHPAVAATSAAPRAQLSGPTWHLSQVSVARAGAASGSGFTDSSISIRFDGAAYRVQSVCDVLGGTVRVDGDALVLGGQHVVQARNCPAPDAARIEQQQAVDNVLPGRVQWSVDGAHLTLARGDTTLTFTR